MKQLLVAVGPTFSISLKHSHRSRVHPRQGWVPVVAAAEQNHYSVLGLNLSASSSDIKTAFRLLARKYHPDVSKDSQASEVFKSIRLAYEVLSNEATRSRYNRALRFEEDTASVQQKRPRYEDYDELKRRMRRNKYWDNRSSETNGVSDKGNNVVQERGSFSEVLRSALVSLFLLQTLGPRPSLVFSSIMALVDTKLDAGYKMGYLVACVLGGRGGVMLTLCLSFASWACGKTSSSIVALVVMAMWVASNLARFVSLPQGAILTLLYMSIKLQADLS